MLRPIMSRISKIFLEKDSTMDAIFYRIDKAFVIQRSKILDKMVQEGKSGALEDHDFR
jgi:hypothetical protein